MISDIIKKIKENPVTSGVIVSIIMITIVLIVVFVKKEKFTYGYGMNSINDTYEIKENFPQPAMNVMYSDATGNLSTTQDLGLQNLTVASDSKFGGNVNTLSQVNVMGKTNYPTNWGGGIRTWDLYGSGNLGWGDDAGNVKASISNNGNITSADANVNGLLNVKGGANIEGRVRFRHTGANGDDDSDPYYLEKVRTSANANALRLTINDDADESFQIWGGSCGAGNCGGDGVMKHKFDASGNATHTGNMSVKGTKLSIGSDNDAGSLESWMGLHIEAPGDAHLRLRPNNNSNQDAYMINRGGILKFWTGDDKMSLDRSGNLSVTGVLKAKNRDILAELDAINQKLDATNQKLDALDKNAIKHNNEIYVHFANDNVHGGGRYLGACGGASCGGQFAATWSNEENRGRMRIVKRGM
jgi:hypothetical protein